MEKPLETQCSSLWLTQVIHKELGNTLYFNLDIIPNITQKEKTRLNQLNKMKNRSHLQQYEMCALDGKKLLSDSRRHSVQIDNKDDLIKDAQRMFQNAYHRQNYFGIPPAKQIVELEIK